MKESKEPEQKEIIGIGRLTAGERAMNILPCPCCGDQENKPILGALGNSQYQIKCPECNLRLVYDRVDKVVGMWNRRELMADRIASLEAEVKEKDEQIAIWVKCIENQNKEIKELKAPFDSGVSAVGNMFELFKGEQGKNTDLQVEIIELQAEVERLERENEILKSNK